MESPRPDASRPRFEWLALALVLLGTVWLYVPAIHTDFFADDFLFLDQVRGRSLIDALRVPDPLSNFFRPVSRQLYFWIVAGLTNESPAAFRIGNLASLLVVIALLFGIVRTLAGPRAAVFAAAFLALHYTADVPVRWACGSQELLAVAGALGAILLHVSGRSGWAGVAMLFGALSKEVVLLTPAIAILAARLPREPWIKAAKRAWPLFAAVAVWALVWLLMPHRRVAMATEVEFDFVQSPLAAFAHLFQVAAGLEWGRRSTEMLRSLPPLVPLALGLAALVIAWRVPARRPREAADAVAQAGAATTEPDSTQHKPVASAKGAGKITARPNASKHKRGEPARAASSQPSRRDRATRETRRVILIGMFWALLATLPVAAVAILWSAYYYLFAMCGVALALGAWLGRRSMPVAAAVLVALAWGSANARWLQEFGVGRDPWTAVSHINDYYIQRSNAVTDGYLASMHRRYPELPEGSTVFFAGLAGNVAFQRADGPLLRWAYRDSSLRSYYLNTFSKEKVRPGPVLFFVAKGDTLQEMARDRDLYVRLASGMVLSDRPESARDALVIAAARHMDDPRVHYLRAWVERALGDTAAASSSLRRTNVVLDASPAPTTALARQRASAGDVNGAAALMQEAVRQHPLDPAAHALLADLLLVRNRRDPEGAIEAYAARTLAPRDPYAWRRWAMIQTDRERYLEALASFQNYRRLGGSTAEADGEVNHWVETIRAAIPKGEVESDVLVEMATP